MTEIRREDIINYINANFQADITTQDLIRPTKAFILRVCNHFLDSFDLTQTDQPSFEVRIHCQSTLVELPSSAQYTLNVYKKVSAIVSQVGCPVVYADFLKPSPKRVYALLIALCQCHNRFSVIKSIMGEFQQTREPIYHEKEKLKADLVDIKSEFESSCIALNTLNAQETEAQKNEAQKLQIEHMKLKRCYEEENERLKKVHEEVREMVERNSHYEMEIAEKKENIRATSEKIIRSPMKIINAAKELRDRKSILNKNIKDLLELDTQKKKIFAKEKDVDKRIASIHHHQMIPLAGILDEAEGQCKSSKEIEDEITKARSNLNSIHSEIHEAKKSLDSQKASNRQTMETIRQKCESIEQILTGIANDLPGMLADSDALSDQAKQTTEKLADMNHALSVLPTRFAQLKEKCSFIDQPSPFTAPLL